MESSLFPQPSSRHTEIRLSYVAAETARLKNEISLKYGLHIKKKSQNLVKMAEDFISPAKASNDYGLPERIVKELTHQEMKDLKQIFDLFDVAGTGYVQLKVEIFYTTIPLYD